MDMHSDQVRVSKELVGQLIRDQFPEWSDHPITPLESKGTVNAMFRVGPHLAARFPLRMDNPAAVQATFEAEAVAARELHENTDVPVPLPLVLGRPGAGFPMPWSVQTWLPGETAMEQDPGGSDAFALDLANFVSRVRSIDLAGRVFPGSVRGGGLREHDTWVEHCFVQSEGLLDIPTLRRMWSRFRELPAHRGNAMTHGDLTPTNVLVADGRLAGVLDFGLYGPADPALDLIPAWHILHAGPRATLRSALQCTDLEWLRGQAWAFQQAMGLVWYYQESHPSMALFARRTLERLMGQDQD
ncbi:MAG: aminoglycoside phosphotransferase family protein [Planctomycetota bacterium]|nr:aminoglycoside phosphotransferase family protein [Planctomycetota bacterium]